MKYNYFLECKKFHVKWEKLEYEYAAAGMSESAIEEMREFDWEEFKRERIISIHIQPLESSFSDGDTAGEDQSPLVNRQINRLSVSQPEIYTWGRLDWIEDIDTPELAKKIKTLSAADLELLSCLVADGLSRAEIAHELGITRSAVTQR